MITSTTIKDFIHQANNCPEDHQGLLQHKEKLIEVLSCLEKNITEKLGFEYEGRENSFSLIKRFGDSRSFISIFPLIDEYTTPRTDKKIYILEDTFVGFFKHREKTGENETSQSRRTMPISDLTDEAFHLLLEKQTQSDVILVENVSEFLAQNKARKIML